MTIQSYKYKSKIATAVAFIAGIIVYIGKDGLTSVIPAEYANWVPIIVMIAGYILAQSTENKRVDVAEQMILEKLGQENPTEDVDPAGEYEMLNDEYTSPGDESD